MRAKIADLKSGQIVYSATCEFGCWPVRTNAYAYVVIRRDTSSFLVPTEGNLAIINASSLAPLCLWTSPEEARQDAVDEAKTRCRITIDNNTRWLVGLDKWRQPREERVCHEHRHYSKTH